MNDPHCTPMSSSVFTIDLPVRFNIEAGFSKIEHCSVGLISTESCLCFVHLSFSNETSESLDILMLF